jgi:hypothetical protein
MLVFIIMITLIHGENTRKSREKLMELRDLRVHSELRMVDGAKMTLTDCIQETTSLSMFGEDVYVIIENLGKQAKSRKFFSELCRIIKESTLDIILWEGNKASVSMQKEFAKATIYEYPIPPVIFKLLDAIAPKNQQFIRLYQQSVTQDAPELVYHMILKRFRELILMKHGIKNEKTQEWQAARLTNQSRLFTMEQLVSMANEFHLLDTSLKNGTLSLPIVQAMRLFFMERSFYE